MERRNRETPQEARLPSPRSHLPRLGRNRVTPLTPSRTFHVGSWGERALILLTFASQPSGATKAGISGPVCVCSVHGIWANHRV